MAHGVLLQLPKAKEAQIGNRTRQAALTEDVQDDRSISWVLVIKCLDCVCLFIYVAPPFSLFSHINMRKWLPAFLLLPWELCHVGRPAGVVQYPCYSVDTARPDMDHSGASTRTKVGIFWCPPISIRRLLHIPLSTHFLVRLSTHQPAPRCRAPTPGWGRVCVSCVVAGSADARLRISQLVFS